MSFNQPNTISCKPIVISSCHQFLKSKIHNSNLTTHYAYQLFLQPWDFSHTWYILALVRVLPLTTMLEIIYLKPELQSSNTILCKPIVTNSCQQFLKSKIHNSNLTTYYAYQLFLQPWDFSHKVWIFHMVDSGIGQGLTSHCHARSNLPETWASINQTLGKSGCI